MSSFDPDQYPGPDPHQTNRAAPGWYPVDHLSQRYWDGYEWTPHVAPLNPGGAPGLSGVMATSDQRSYALVMHLGSLFVGFLVPLVMWVIKKDESPFINDHGKQIMNWTISATIYGIISFVLIFVIIGIFLILALVVLHVVFSVQGAIAANKGERYKYPLAIQFFS